MEPKHGTELVPKAVYELSDPAPGQRKQVEIVFMYGLLVNVDLKDAYYKTWRIADGQEGIETWLVEKYPNARILSLAYDSAARQAGTAGNMSLRSLGKHLLDQMVSTEGNIGQNDCPVIFVCHSVGGLIVKEIVVRCKFDHANPKYQNLLRNIKAFYFYATPHGGSDLTTWNTKLADWFPFVEKSSLVEYLKPKPGTDRNCIHQIFVRALDKDCKFYVAAEGRGTNPIRAFKDLAVCIVHENSARIQGHDFVMHKDADHATVCKPQSKIDTRYLKLTDCIDQVTKGYLRSSTVDLSSSVKVSSGGVISRTLSMEPQHGTELVKETIYEFGKPDSNQRPEVEVVFFPGLQKNVADSKDAYYKTWTTANGKEVWPETWLREKYPNARILSLDFKSLAPKTKTTGNVSIRVLSKRLLGRMVSTHANIGQNDCPVIFVCHSVGGLIAMEVVLRCTSDRANTKYQNLLHRLKAVYFYATPHGGCKLDDFWITKLADGFPFVEKSSLVEYLKPGRKNRVRTQKDFLQAVDKDCKFSFVAEGQKSNLFPGYKKLIVDEESAKFPDLHHSVIIQKDANHMTVCKPQSKKDKGYAELIQCIDEVMEQERTRTTVDLSAEKLFGIEDKIKEVSELLEKPEILMVGIIGRRGAGKTTLSKRVYNLHAYKYEKSCYIEDCEYRSVKDVQRELLRGLCGEQLLQDRAVEEHHLDMIKDCILTQKVFVVIDNMSSMGYRFLWNNFVMDEDVSRSVDWLWALQVFHDLETGSKSKVVVVGQTNAILPMKYLDVGKAVIVPMNGIRDPEGSDLQLFLHHALDASGEDAKEEGNAELLAGAKGIVEYLDGLPLGLEEIGKFLGWKKYKDLQHQKEEWAEMHRNMYMLQILKVTDGNLSSSWLNRFEDILLHWDSDMRLASSLWDLAWNM